MNSKSYLLLSIVMVGISARADTACVGFTGMKCDRTYPATVLGLHCASQDRPHGKPWEMIINGGVYSFGEPVYCSDDELREVLRDGWYWLPWNRHRDRLTVHEFESVRGGGAHFEEAEPSLFYVSEGR